MIIRLFSSKVWQPVFVILAASLLLLPALWLGHFSLAILGVTGLALSLFLFSRPLYALILYIVLIPIEEFIVIDSLGTLTRLAAILFFGSYMFHRRLQLRTSVLSWQGWLWLGWVTASLIWSLQPDTVGFSQLLQLLLMVLLVADFTSRQPNHVHTLLDWYSASAFVVAVIGIYNFFQGLDVTGALSGSARTSALENQSVAHFAFYMIPAFLRTFHLSLDDSRTVLRRSVSALSSAVFVTAMLMSGTRGAWLAVVVALVATYLPKFTLAQWLRFLGLALITGILLFQIPIVQNFVAYRTDEAISSGGAGRLNIWRIGFQIFLDHPLIGVGFRNFEEGMSFARFEQTPFNLELDNPFTSRVAHNIYLQVAAELGIIGLGLFLAWLWRLWRMPSYKGDNLVVLALLIATLVGGLTNPSLNRKYFWLSIALAEGVRASALTTRQRSVYTDEYKLQKDF
jgi:exopolysaccharide production protein ExoQ